jgi:hypothetical protein
VAEDFGDCFFSAGYSFFSGAFGSLGFASTDGFCSAGFASLLPFGSAAGFGVPFDLLPDSALAGVSRDRGRALLARRVVLAHEALGGRDALHVRLRRFVADGAISRENLRAAFSLLQIFLRGCGGAQANPLSIRPQSTETNRAFPILPTNVWLSSHLSP